MSDVSPTSEMTPVARALGIVADIDEPEFDKLLVEIDREPLPHDVDGIVARAHGIIPETPKAEIRSLISFGTAIAATASRAKEDPEFFESLKDRAERDLQRELPNNFRDRLFRLASSKALAFVGGGAAALRDNSYLMISSEARTDLRAIPMPSSASAKHYAILHRLRLNFLETSSSDSHKTIELVLDYNDLKELEEAVSQALQAQRTVQKSIGDMGGVVFSPFDIEGDESDY